jgi:hypothetical protein
MDSIVQVIGSLLVLVPFVLVQAKRLTTSSRLFLVLNVLGSTVLAVEAAVGHQWGFLLLEGVWATVSAFGLARTIARSAPVSE